MIVSMSDDGIVSAIGETRLIRLNRVLKDLRFRLYAKLEGLNPGGSIKDRAALSILRRGFETGEIRPDTVVIESSSGNMGIGLAQLCASLGLRLICVVDAKTTPQNIAILKAYGAGIDLIREPDPASGEFLQARLERVRALLAMNPNSFWPNRGCAEYVRSERMKTLLYAVDAVGSAIFGGKKANRLIPGHGASVVPQLHQPDLVDRCIHVSDLDCIVGGRLLVREEGILAGGSSGGVLMALNRVRSEIPDGSNCVVIFPDRGERYLETVFSDSWVAEHFGDVSHLWENFEKDKCPVATS